MSEKVAEDSGGRNEPERDGAKQKSPRRDRLSAEKAEAQEKNHPLWEALRQLAQEAGVQREDLPDALRDNLSELRYAWDIDPTQAVDVIRGEIVEKLEGYVTDFDPRPGGPNLSTKDRRRQYQDAVLIRFHVWKYLGSDGTRLEDRKAWLAADARGILTLSESTSDRDFVDAINKIVLLTPDYERPPVAVIETPQHQPTSAVAPPKPPAAPPELPLEDPVADKSVVKHDQPPVRKSRVKTHLTSKYHKPITTVATGLLLGGFAVYGLTPVQSLPYNMPSDQVTENPIGDAIKVDVQSIYSPNFQSGIAFAGDQVGDSQRILTLAETVGVPRATYADALDSGAYLVGGAELALKLSTKAPGKDVVLFKVRAIETSYPVATGIAIRQVGEDWNYQPYETFAERAGILLEGNINGHADAHEVDHDGHLLGPYLAQHQVPVNQTNAPQLILDLYAREWAYQFTVELEYTVDGESYSQLVTFNGKPFRVSADICVTPAMLGAMSSSTRVNDLRNMRYSAVAVPDTRPGATKGAYTTGIENPDSFARACQTQTG